ncbi:hypothetical protein [Sphingomonas sp.]|uniref:hypothetical protein n=1 Tax=Sphingomonas sp. TaxID=28214 RepID=UPI001ECDA998|nr:hypothetical protein [Sphingomonas sp.]MBX3594968.1 hypothetical protein [Sphingomonas sp.]
MYRVPVLAALALLSACAATPRVATAPAPATPPVPMRAGPPAPPDGAAPNLSIPARLADGGYATPNRDLSPAGAVWHLRAAFNVAALNCPDPMLAQAYNRLLTAHRETLATAHRRLAAEYGGADRFDPAMTRLYNYFAQPPAAAGFCAVAAPLLREAASLPAGQFAAFAPTAIAAIDRPFTAFYARYDDWRIAVAAWRRGESGPPQLAYDTAVFVADAVVTGGREVTAAR